MNVQSHLRYPRSEMKPWSEKLVVILMWLIAGWVAWDFLQWIDPPIPRDLVAHPLRISPETSELPH